jgi:hypothetical protein
MGEPHVVSALRDKRSELAGLVIQLEKQLGQHRVNLAHIDATMRLFDPDIQPEAVRANQPRGRSEWFRPGVKFQQRYVKSHRNLGNCRWATGFGQFYSSQGGHLFSRSVLGA